MSNNKRVKTKLNDMELVMKAQEKVLGWTKQDMEIIDPNGKNRLVGNAHQVQDNIKDAVAVIRREKIKSNPKMLQKAKEYGIGTYGDFSWRVGSDGTFEYNHDDYGGTEEQRKKFQQDLYCEYGKLKSEKDKSKLGAVTVSPWSKEVGKDGEWDVMIVEADSDDLDRFSGLQPGTLLGASKKLQF